MSNRIPQVNKLIKEELGRIILQEVEVPTNNLTTITRVETVSNLSQSYIYISTIGKDTEEIFEILEKNVYHIQQSLNKRLNMRPVPKIIFKKEQETERAAHVEELLEKVKEK